MSTVAADWELFFGILQWLVVPAVVLLGQALWNHEKRLNGNDREILRLLTVMEEREKHRLAIRQAEHDTIAELRDVIESMGKRLDRLAEAIASLQGKDGTK